VALAVVAAATVALVGDRGSDEPLAGDDGGAEEPGDSGDPGGGEPVEIVGAGAHDPFGSGSEHGDEAVHAHDGDPGTSWHTQRYRGDPALGGLKSGVGVWFELAEARSLREVVVSTPTPGASFTLYAGDAQPEPGVGPEAWGREVARVDRAAAETEVELGEPAEGRVWLLWLTSLPADDDGGFRARISEVELRSE
jgi:putative peptidoglycan lipid II flippase